MEKVNILDNPEVEALKILVEALVKTMPPNADFDAYVARSLEMHEQASTMNAALIEPSRPGQTDYVEATRRHLQMLRGNVLAFQGKPMPNAPK